MAKRNQKVWKPQWPYVLNSGSDQADGLVGWWPGIERSPTFLDLTGRGNVASIIGALPASGIYGTGQDSGRNAFKASGATNYLDAGVPTYLDGVAAFSLVAWINIASFTDFTGIIGKGNVNTNMIEFITGGTGAGSNDGLFVRIANGANNFGVTGAGLFTAGQWAHVGVAYNGNGSGNAGKVQVYFNGSGQTLTFTNTVPSTTNTNSNHLTFANDLFVNTILNGKIEDIRIYNRTLSANEFFALYNPTTRWQLRYQPGKVRYFLTSGVTTPPIGRIIEVNQSVKSASLF
jgi:hypothetical protein